MNNIPSNNHLRGIGGEEPPIPRPFDSHRPPTLNPECRGHGGLDVACNCGAGNGEYGGINGSQILSTASALALSDADADADSEMNESINGQEGIEDLAMSERGAEARRATFTYAACSYDCICANCSHNDGDPQPPPEDAWSIAASAASSRPSSPHGSMIVEVGSMASSSHTILRSPTPPHVADLFTFMLGGADLTFVHTIPNSLVHSPLWLTPTVELVHHYPHQVNWDDGGEDTEGGHWFSDHIGGHSMSFFHESWH